MVRKQKSMIYWKFGFVCGRKCYFREREEHFVNTLVGNTGARLSHRDVKPICGRLIYSLHVLVGGHPRGELYMKSWVKHTSSSFSTQGVASDARNETLPDITIIPSLTQIGPDLLCYQWAITIGYAVIPVVEFSRNAVLTRLAGVPPPLVSVPAEFIHWD